MGISLLAAIYCIAINSVTYSHFNAAYGNQQTTEQEQFLATVSNSLFCHTAQSERSVSGFNNIPAAKFESLSHKLWSLSTLSKPFLEAKFTQYLNSSTRFLIYYRIRDLLFPFHYFW